MSHRNGFQGKWEVKKKSGTSIENITPENLKENMSKKLTRQEFKKEVMESQALSLVKFKIEWSGACQIISPIYEELSKSYTGTVNFFTIDVEKETGIDKEYGVIEIPTILFFKRGRLVDHVSGLVPKNVVITKIENALSLN